MDVSRAASSDRFLIEQCAGMMASSEPWLTLQRSFDAAVAALQDPAKELYVVRDGDDEGVTAFILLDFRGPLTGYIQSICVRADRRGRGLGAALISWAEERIGRDSPNVFLCVSSFNTGARRLYERLGYEVIGRFRDFIVSGHDELLLRKTAGPWGAFRASRDDGPDR